MTHPKNSFTQLFSRNRGWGAQQVCWYFSVEQFYQCSYQAELRGILIATSMMYILFSEGGDNIYKGVLQSGGWYQPPQKMLWEEFTESHHCKILLFFNFLIHFHFLFSHSEPVAKVDEAWVILYIVSISYSFIKLLLRQQVYVEPSKG